jgi:hypothetical protein
LGHFARLRLDEGHKCDHAGIDQPGKEADQEQETQKARHAGGLRSPKDHDDFGLIQSKIMKRDRFNKLERDAGEKPVSTFSHPALKSCDQFRSPWQPLARRGAGNAEETSYDNAGFYHLVWRQSPS